MFLILGEFILLMGVVGYGCLDFSESYFCFQFKGASNVGYWPLYSFQLGAVLATKGKLLSELGAVYVKIVYCLMTLLMVMVSEMSVLGVCWSLGNCGANFLSLLLVTL